MGRQVKISLLANTGRAASQILQLVLWGARAVLGARHTLTWNLLYLEVRVEDPEEGAHFGIAGTFQHNEASWPVLAPGKRNSTA